MAGSMTRRHLIIEGRVQRVNYRDYVQERAQEFGVKGYVENMPDGTVEIICEGPKRNVEDFVELIKSGADICKKEGDLGMLYRHVVVKNVEVLEEKPLGKYNEFSIHYGSFQEELTQKFGAAQYALEGIEMKYGVFKDISRTMAEALVGINQTLADMKEMLKKIDDQTKKEKEV